MRRQTKRAGILAPPSLCRMNCSLAPVAFDHHVFAVTMDPVVRDPALTFMWRTIVAAWSPDVLAAFVAVVAALPYVSLSGRWAAPLVDWGWWSDANLNLREGSRRDQGKSEQQCQSNFLHDGSSPPGVGWFRDAACVPEPVA